MKDYHKILDLPKDASEEQIKAQYKLLVRVYHPDRFSKSDDRSYAEQKIKEINEAYSALLKPTAETTYSQKEGQPVPVVIPTYVDFGTLALGEKKAIPLTVSNARGEVVDLQFDFSDRRWFSLNESKLLTESSQAPLQFEVVANTDELPPGRTYKGWIDVRMKNNVTRVNLAVKIARQDGISIDGGTVFRNIVLGGSLVAIAAAAAYLGPRYLSSNNSSAMPENNLSIRNANAMSIAAPDISTNTQSLRGSNPLLNSLVTIDTSTPGATRVLSAESDRILYSILDGSELALYTSAFDGSEQHRLKFAGQYLAWSQDGSRLAYTFRQNGTTQIFIAQSSERTGDQVTNSPELKTDLVWAPDGSQIAYIQHEGESRVLYVTSPGGRSPRALSDRGLGSVGNFSWSPDGRTLLFDVVDSAQKNKIYRVDADGSDLKQFTDLDAYDPVWSPDGTVILAASNRGIFALDTQGVVFRQLSEKPARLPRWSFDSGNFAYIAGAKGSNANVELVVSDIGNRKPQVVAKGAILNFAWAPSQDRIGYVTGRYVPGETSSLYLWSVAPGDKKPTLLAETNDPSIAWVP